MTDQDKAVEVKMNTGVQKTKKPRGFEEETDRSDLLIPRAKKLEQMSPEVSDGDMKAGQIINSVTGEELPEKFIPIFFFKQWIRFNPRDSKSPDYNSEFGPGDIVWRSSDPNDPRVQEEGRWIGDQPPKATAFLNFFSLFEGQEMPIIVSFCNTSYKAGKTLLSLAKFTGGDMFGKKYSLTTKKTQNDLGTFYVMNVKLAGLPTDEEFKKAETFYDSFRGKDIQVHAEEEQATTKVPF